MFRRRRDEGDNGNGAATDGTPEAGAPDLPTLKPFLRAGLDDTTAAARPAAPS